MNIDINCDMGESFGRYTLGSDEALMAYVTSANIACGYHAGDPLVISQTVELAISKGVAIGAHPGFPDLVGFGRRPMNLTPVEIESCVIYQIGAVAAFARANQGLLAHVKPHGSLYNMAAEREDVANAVVRGVARYSLELILIGPPSSPLEEMARRAGLRYAREGYIDRTYNANGTLTPRSISGSLIDDPVKAAAQAVSIIEKGTVDTISGETIPLEVDTICIHGDSPSALATLMAVRNSLEDAGCGVQSLGSLLHVR